MTPTTRIGIAAIVVAAAAFGLLRWQASRTTPTVGFWFDVESTELSAATTADLGGPITPEELARVEAIAREELVRAFSGLRIVVTDNRQAFWRLQVRHLLDVDESSPYKGWPAGVAQARMLGPLGGHADISFYGLAQYAVTLAPRGASRDEKIAGTGRGIARAAAHEFGHFIASGTAHDKNDVNSYEYPHADRASQYYGELHWTTAWPELQARLGSQKGQQDN